MVTGERFAAAETRGIFRGAWGRRGRPAGESDDRQAGGGLKGLYVAESDLRLAYDGDALPSTVESGGVGRLDIVLESDVGGRKEDGLVIAGKFR